MDQQSAPPPLLFIVIIMDILASEIDTEPPRAVLFADDLVLCETYKTAVEREGRYREGGERERERERRERTGNMARPIIRKTWTESHPDKNTVHAVQGL